MKIHHSCFHFLVKLSLVVHVELGALILVTQYRIHVTDHNTVLFMFQYNLTVVIALVLIVMYFLRFVFSGLLGFILQSAMAEVPQFRILAPPFLCPREKDVHIDKRDYTIITLQSDSLEDVIFKWTVRWDPLTATTQRLILALWKTVRVLEKQLNGVQSEPGVYIINNTELLSGVNYTFNVTATFVDDIEVVEKSFNIDNMQGDQKLLIEGRSNMFSIVLVGASLIYANQRYLLEAQVITCYKTQDYYFEWLASTGNTDLKVSDTKGSKLEIKPRILKPGLTYNVLCKVYKFSNKEYITENGLTFRVIHRDLNINLNFDVLVIPIRTQFYVYTDIERIDYRPSEISVSWECTWNNKSYNGFDNNEFGSLNFPEGLPDVGEYYVSVTVVVLKSGIIASTTARIKTIHTQLPLIKVFAMPRIFNEGNLLNLQANVSDVVPGCSISWYFYYDDCLSPANTSNKDTCKENKHGIQISDEIHFYSLEENFLSELIDYSNETTWKYVTTDIQAASGTARIIAHCERNKDNNCSSENTVYADIKIKINENPSAGEVIIMPKIGTAMETIFRISTLGSQGPNRPYLYTFYCGLGNNESLMLGEYLEYSAIETFLPYIDDDNGTAVWVEVCDSLGACSFGIPTVVKLGPGEARTLEQLIEDMKACIMRCELTLLRRLVTSTIVTYLNAGQTDAHTKFMSILLDTTTTNIYDCKETYLAEYNTFLDWLTTNGIQRI